MRNISEIHATRWLLWHLDFMKFNFYEGGGTYDAPPDRLVGWRGGYTSLFLTPWTPSASRSQRLWHQAYLDPPSC